MNHYVYRTACGLLRTVRADDIGEAWIAAGKRHRPTYLFSLSGEAWTWSLLGGAVRERDADVPAGHARVLYLDACDAELSPAVKMYLRARAESEGACFWQASERCALCDRGLIAHTGTRAPLTDLGRAFVERHRAAAGGGQ